MVMEHTFFIYWREIGRIRWDLIPNCGSQLQHGENIPISNLN